MPRSTHRIRLSALVSSALASLALSSLCVGQQAKAEEPVAFDERKRITAMDVVVDFDASGLREWAKDGPVPKQLRPEDFEVSFDGQPRTVVAVESFGGPWETVIYFDAVLTSGADLRWAATALADSGVGLSALGPVTVVVADPAPRTLLSSTSDPERVHAVLSQLTQTLEGQDELVALRSEVVAELRGEDSGLTVADLESVARGEALRVGERHDDLLLSLVDIETITAHRLLVLASGGFDLHPNEFYQPLIAQLRESFADPEGDIGLAVPMIASTPPLAAETSTVPARPQSPAVTTDILAQTLASYGWVTIALAPPRPKVLKPGLRIGKFRLSGPGIVFDEDENRTLFKFLGATFEEHRKPERAEAYLELGAALEGQGKLEQATDAYQQAIYYFSGDPRTADQQAAAYVYLGKVLELRHKTPQATEAFKRANQLDPNFTYEAIGPTAELLDPLAPLRKMAHTTVGHTVRRANQLSTILDELRRRVRLTYQVAGQPDGKLHALEARYLGPPRQLRHSLWARHSIPESIAAARARRLLTGEPSGGDWQLNAISSPTATAGRLAVTLDLEVGSFERTALADAAVGEGTAVDGESVVLRLTIAIGGPEIEPRVEHRALGAQSLADLENWHYRFDVDLGEDEPWLALLVEDLASGVWGGRLIELP